MDKQIQITRPELRNSQIALILKGLELVHDIAAGFDDEIMETRAALRCELLRQHTRKQLFRQH